MAEEKPNLSEIDTDFINLYIKKLTEHSNDFHDKLVILETKSEIFMQRFQDAQKEIEILKGQLDDHATTASVNSELSGKVNDHENTIKKLQEEIAKANEQIDTLKNEKNSLQHIVNQKNDETESLSNQLKQYTNPPLGAMDPRDIDDNNYSDSTAPPLAGKTKTKTIKR